MGLITIKEFVKRKSMVPSTQPALYHLSANKNLSRIRGILIDEKIEVIDKLTVKFH